MPGYEEFRDRARLVTQDLANASANASMTKSPFNALNKTPYDLVLESVQNPYCEAYVKTSMKKYLTNNDHDKDGRVNDDNNRNGIDDLVDQKYLDLLEKLSADKDNSGIADWIEAIEKNQEEERSNLQTGAMLDSFEIEKATVFNAPKPRPSGSKSTNNDDPKDDMGYKNDEPEPDTMKNNKPKTEGYFPEDDNPDDKGPTNNRLK